MAQLRYDDGSIEQRLAHATGDLEAAKESARLYAKCSQGTGEVVDDDDRVIYRWKKGDPIERERERERDE